MKQFVKVYWEWILGSIAFVLFVFNAVIFYPGFMSFDSLEQLAQAVGQRAYFDWHPPAMAGLWALGILITGKVASLLILQLTLLWAALLIGALFVYRQTKSRWLSLLPLGFGLLPFVLSISGVIWKDTHMAIALLVATMLSLIIPYQRKKVAIALGVIAAGMLVYALLLRYNAVLAVIPIVYLLARSFTPQRKIIFASAAGILLLALISNQAVQYVLKVEKSNPVSVVMVDDVVNTLDAATIKKSPVNEELKRDLLTMQRTCQEKGVLLHSTNFCTSNGNQSRTDFGGKYYGDLLKLWTTIPTTHLSNYAAYRIHTFALFLVTPQKYVYVQHDGIDPNELGQEVRHPALAAVLRAYVVEFASRDYGFLFRPYVWLALAIGIMIYILRKPAKYPYRATILCLSLSAILYIVGYLPVVVAGDYRYVYWSVFAVSIAGMLLILNSRK